MTADGTEQNADILLDKSASSCIIEARAEPVRAAGMAWCLFFKQSHGGKCPLAVSARRNGPCQMLPRSIKIPSDKTKPRRAFKAAREEQVLDKFKLRIGSAVACAALAMGGVSCQKERRAPSDEGSVRSGVMGQHWVQDERLRGVMAELSRQAAHWPAGVPDDPESRSPDSETSTAFRDAQALADGLAKAARDIPRAVADREMSAETRRGFNAEAERLRTQALALRDAARGRKVERMQRALDGISSSCISCHSQYRDFTGELGPRKASAE